MDTWTMKFTPGVPEIKFKLTFNWFNNMFEGSWDNTSLIFNSLATLHGVCFSCTGLTICEDCSVVTFENTFNNGESSLLENILLFAGRLKDEIKAEISFLLPWLFAVSDNDFATVWNNIDNGLVAVGDFI